MAHNMRWSSKFKCDIILHCAPCTLLLGCHDPPNGCGVVYSHWWHGFVYSHLWHSTSNMCLNEPLVHFVATEAPVPDIYRRRLSNIRTIGCLPHVQSVWQQQCFSLNHPRAFQRSVYVEVEDVDFGNRNNNMCPSTQVTWNVKD